MICRNNCSPGNLKFIKSIPEGFKFGTPLKINNETFYPINHYHLFLRYYVNYSGYIFDIVTNKCTKYSYDSNIIFYSTENGQYIKFSLKEIIWITFYRFQEGESLDVGNKITIYPQFVHDKKDGDYYLINGVQFNPVKFPLDSHYYNEFVKNNRMRLIVSENGAIFDNRAKCFLMVHLDENGCPFIYSKNYIKFKVSEIIAYAWLHKVYDYKSHMIKSTMFSESFISKNNMIIYTISNGNFVSVNKNLLISNLAYGVSDGTLRNINDGKVIENKYRVPLVGLNDTTYITFSGLLIRNRTIVTPYAIVRDKDTKEIVDVLYKFPKIDKIFSIIDIFMWTFYRLTKSVVSILDVKFVDTKIGIPLIEDLEVVTKTEPISDHQNPGCMIGSEWFYPLRYLGNTYCKLFISKNGAIFNTQYKSFHAYNVSSLESKGTINVYTDNKETWIKMKRAMYDSWISRELLRRKKIKSNLLITMNGINTDISIYNLRVAHELDYNGPIRIDLENKIGTNNFNYLMNEYPIPEVII